MTFCSFFYAAICCALRSMASFFFSSGVLPSSTFGFFGSAFFSSFGFSFFSSLDLSSFFAFGSHSCLQRANSP